VIKNNKLGIMDQTIKQKICVLIPVFNEEESIAKVLDDIPKSMVDEMIVIDNGSTDKSASIAKKHGATVLFEPQRGYGAACLKGIRYLEKKIFPEIVVFLDGDYSDYPGELKNLVNKINEGYDFVLGSRILGISEYGAQLSSHSIFGNKLAAFFLKHLFSGHYTDLGPFRAIKFKHLLKLNMIDTNYGWTMEMQIKALRNCLKIVEVPVHYRERYAGTSKVTGNLLGSIKAFSKITYIVILYFFRVK
jgi:glycosyltransferase involved in cell wall biosynthesis